MQDGADVVARALGLEGSPWRFRFEAELKSGLPGAGPTLDLLLEGSGGAACGVEAKFTEPFQPRDEREAPFRPSYFQPTKGRWARLGLTGCQALADAMHEGQVSFRHLDAAQLLKHVLGLRSNFDRADLLLLRYDAGTEEDTAFANEITRFSVSVDPQLGFRALTYQEVFARLSAEPATSPDYLGYLLDRYFSP